MNQLRHADEFRRILANHHLSDTAKQTLAGVRLVLLVGPTSSGRNSIINELLKTGEYHYIISDTTREPRVKDGVPVEQNGREYWFRSEGEVLDELQDGEFLEAALIHGQQVSGVSIREIEKARAAGRIAITDIEPQGAAWVHGLKPDTLIVFVVPPSLDALLQRLHRRSDLPDSEIRRRLQTSAEECTRALSADYYTFVINDEFAKAVAEVDGLVRRQMPPSHVVQQAARAAAEQLVRDIEVYLAA